MEAKFVSSGYAECVAEAFKDIGNKEVWHCQGRGTSFLDSVGLGKDEGHGGKLILGHVLGRKENLCNCAVEFSM